MFKLVLRLAALVLCFAVRHSGAALALRFTAQRLRVQRLWTSFLAGGSNCSAASRVVVRTERFWVEWIPLVQVHRHSAPQC